MSEQQQPEKKMSATELLREELKRKGHPGYRDEKIDEDTTATPSMDLPPMEGFDAEIKPTMHKVVMEEIVRPTEAIDMPRLELRLEAFKTYERFIAKGCRGSYIVDYEEIQFSGHRRTKSARTFCLRFRDALLGFTRYKYASDLIPAEYPVTCLSPVELTNGGARIINKYYEILIQSQAVAGNKHGLVYVALFLLSKGVESIPTAFHFASAGDVAYFESLCSSFNLAFSKAGGNVVSVTPSPRKTISLPGLGELNIE